MTNSRASSIEKIGAAIAAQVKDGALLGLGSGSTVATLLPSISHCMAKRRVSARWVPTSLQIEIEAQKAGMELARLTRPRVDLAVDGADQVDDRLNMIKGGGGALLREKVLLSSAKKSIIVADETKLAKRLCMNGTRVPLEVSPFARVPASRRLKVIGGRPEMRLDQRRFPFYTENGNIILDTLFEPIENPAELEEKTKAIPGVVETGIFTVRPLEVFAIGEMGDYKILRKG